MATFTDFITDLLDEVDRSNTDVEAYLRRSTIRALKDVSRYRVPWMESTFNFTTVANQAEYDSTTSGFPADVATFHVIYLDDPYGYRVLENRPLHEVRRALDSTDHGYLSSAPLIYAYHHRKLILAPVVGALVIYCDYAQDARRDSTTGNLIVSTDTTVTNNWFDEGEDILRSWVMGDYYRSFARDDASAAAYDSTFLRALRAARDQVANLQMSGLRASYNY